MTSKRNVPKKSSSPPSEERQSKVEIRIPNDAEFVRVVRLALTGIAARLSFSYDEIEDIKLAVSEACNNAIQHASVNKNGAGQVLIECLSSATRLVVTIQDDGPGLPPSAAKKAKQLPGQPESGGLGMYLMQALMDEVHTEASPKSGTRVQMIKYVQRPELEKA